MFTSDLAPFIPKRYIELANSEIRYVTTSNEELCIYSDESKVSGTEIAVVGPEKKFLITLQKNFFHALAETLVDIWREHKLNKNVLFVFAEKDLEDYVNIQNRGIDSIYSLFFELLDKNNVKYIRADIGEKNGHSPDRPGSYLKINNFYYIERKQSANSPVELKEVVDLLLDMVVGADKPMPEKKVYLTRKHADPGPSPDGVVFPEHILFKDDRRLNDEEIVEQYFRNLGFEIIVPEEFESFSEQIKYMSTVKTLVSVTSSGLLNTLFMQDGGLLVELLTPLYRNFGAIPDKSIHSYTFLSYLKKLTHVSIPHDRDPAEILAAIESKPHFKNLLEA